VQPEVCVKIRRNDVMEFTLAQNAYLEGIENCWTFESLNSIVCFLPCPTPWDVGAFLSWAHGFALDPSRKCQKALVFDSRCSDKKWRYETALPRLSHFLALQGKNQPNVIMVLFCVFCEQPFDCAGECFSCEDQLDAFSLCGDDITKIEIDDEWLDIIC